MRRKGQLTLGWGRSAFLVLGVIVGFAVIVDLRGTQPASAQISPGKLSFAHQFLDGPQNCNECHSPQAEFMSAKCQSCHTAIETLVEDKRGFHGKLTDPRCETCHPEHAGREFDLIYWENGSPEKFDHSKTGWKLEGAHGKLDCQSCHTPLLQDAAFMKTAQTKHPEESWLGLAGTCNSCHGDAHGGSLGADCSSCHGSEVWAEVPGFDHAKTDYPLTGKHQETECEACHGKLLEVFGSETALGQPPIYSLDHGQCSACHQDAHEGRFGTQCSDCHQTSGFGDINQAGFDHAKTNFPLTGSHELVSCNTCHDPDSGWGKRPEFSQCSSCHEDPHAGKATLAGAKVDCASCHSTASFTPSTLTVADHDQTDFPLLGMHKNVLCSGCHKESGAEGQFGSAQIQFHPEFGSCADCHETAHGDQSLSAFEAESCQSCHSVEHFSPSTFTVEDHRGFGFDLEGAHESVVCAACHSAKQPFLGAERAPTEMVGSAGLLFSMEQKECSNCHFDIHGGTTLNSAECASCHNTEGFSPSTVSAETHNPKLEGAHLAVPCFECHNGLLHEPVLGTLIPGTKEGSHILFSEAGKVCSDCHQTPHGEQLSLDCSTCHSQAQFIPADNFNHDKSAAFSLKGAHENVPCGSCHAANQDGQVIYKPIPFECSDCHGNLDEN